MPSVTTISPPARKPPQRMQRLRSGGRTRVGAAVVEFAFVAPLFILLTLGMMEVSRMVMVKQLLINASREGARMAVLPNVTAQEVTTQVTQQLSASALNGVQISIQPAELSGAAVGTPITVSLSVPAASVGWIPNPVFAMNHTLTASTTMRKESQ
jgi:Flp pilus assembly protein TadG